MGRSVGRGHTRSRCAAVIAICLAVPICVAGCAGHTASSMNRATYTNTAFEFSIAYDAARLQKKVGDETGAVLELSLSDTSDADRPYSFLPKVPGGMVFVVQNMNTTQTPPPASAMPKFFREHAADAAFNPPSPRMANLRQGKLSSVTLNGMRGYRTTFTWTGARSVHYALFVGRYVFRVDVTASSEAWPSIWPEFEAVMRSLKPTR
jgi:hypothetical protein